MPERLRPRTFVLVPGAWLGGWSWHPVAQLLSEDGHRVIAPTLPGLSYGSPAAGLRLVDAVDFLVAEVERRGLDDVVLVSHSWGGYPATGAAHRLVDRISQVVYHSAVVPARGVAMSGENEDYAQQIHAAIASTSDGTVPLPLDAVRLGLMPGEPPEMQELVHRLSVPQPGGYMTDALDVPDVTTIGLPASYVLGAEDQSLARPGAEFAARIGVEPVQVPGGHLAMFTSPADTARALTGLL